MATETSMPSNLEYGTNPFQNTLVESTELPGTPPEPFLSTSLTHHSIHSPNNHLQIPHHGAPALRILQR